MVRRVLFSFKYEDVDARKSSGWMSLRHSVRAPSEMSDAICR
jgi:hypothetical protein